VLVLLQRVARFAVAVACVLALVAALAPGCKDPTQVTLEIVLRKDAECGKIKVQTAITVGVEPVDTEHKVETEFVHAQTDHCDPITKEVGTLVVTPSDKGRAAVVVVVGFGAQDPASCKPPKYKGCVVARRRFTFPKSKPLRLPILIDPYCTDVPCDAFTTCRDGRCFDAETDTDTCGPDGCLEPGETPDGSTNIDAAIEVDGSPPPPDASPDAPNDAPPDGTQPGPLPPQCSADNKLQCSNGFGTYVSCSQKKCCDTGPPVGPVCEGTCISGGPRFCCADTDCTTTQTCPPAAQSPPGPARICQEKAPQPAATCTNKKLNCYQAGGGPVGQCAQSCCELNLIPTCDSSAQACGEKYCCEDAHCAVYGQVCAATVDNGQAAKCMAPPTTPYCLDDGSIACGGVTPCNGVCCEPQGGVAACNAGATSCPNTNKQYCCPKSPCAQGTCLGFVNPGPGAGKGAGVCQ
jgi:hypothetical protein